MGQENGEGKLIAESLTEQILGAIEVHRALGPGLLESAYESCLAHELLLRGIPFERQKAIAVVYKGHTVDCGYRADLIVAKAVVVELKAVDRLAPIHEAQLFSHMRLTNVRVGLLINFNVIVLRDGIKRRVI